tara:strand:+ start:348 stop:605 length:258 start_codon:yes stop_codon:yes gene_type:complete
VTTTNCSISDNIITASGPKPAETKPLKHPIKYKGEKKHFGVVTPGISTKYTEDNREEYPDPKMRYIVLPRTLCTGGIATKEYEDE